MKREWNRSTTKKELCEGCNRQEEMIAGWGIWYCTAYRYPYVWLNQFGNCPLYNNPNAVAKAKKVKFVNPLKASKRGG